MIVLLVAIKPIFAFRELSISLFLVIEAFVRGIIFKLDYFLTTNVIFIIEFWIYIVAFNKSIAVLMIDNSNTRLVFRDVGTNLFNIRIEQLYSFFEMSINLNPDAIS